MAENAEVKSKEQLFKEWLKFKKQITKANSNLKKVEVALEGIYGTDFKEKSKTFIMYHRDSQKGKNGRSKFNLLSTE